MATRPGVEVVLPMHVEAESVLSPGCGGHPLVAALPRPVQVVMNAVVAALGVKLRLALLHRTRR